MELTPERLSEMVLRENLRRAQETIEILRKQLTDNGIIPQA